MIGVEITREGPMAGMVQFLPAVTLWELRRLVRN